MKHLKKKLRKKTVEAFACKNCGDPSDCLNVCIMDDNKLDTHAYTFATLTINSY